MPKLREFPAENFKELKPLENGLRFLIGPMESYKYEELRLASFMYTNFPDVEVDIDGSIIETAIQLLTELKAMKDLM